MPPDLTVQEHTTLASLPEGARALFGQGDIYSTLAWYSATAAHALPTGATPLFLTISAASEIRAVIPLQKAPGRALSSLTTPYTGHWHPLLAPDLDGSALQSVAAALAAYCRAYPTTRLDALDTLSPFWPLLKTASRTGKLAPLAFNHFGNWHEHLPDRLDWTSYLAARPGALRESIRRKAARLLKKEGVRFVIATMPDALSGATGAYDQVYAASWKQPEPFPDFLPAFMHLAAAAGFLRLALLYVCEQPVAAQIWTVHRGIATVMKLAHRQDMDSLSPGTVLTAYTIRHLLEAETINTLDFGRGDDSYKALWTSARNQRGGLVLANFRSMQGASATLKHFAGKAFRKALHLNRDSRTA